MKRQRIKMFLVAVAFIIATNISFAQTPYDSFMPNLKEKKMLELEQNKYVVSNLDTTNAIRSIELDMNNYTLKYLSDSGISIASIQLDAHNFKWLSVDPLADHAKNIGASPYNFCMNNPILLIDPNGALWDSTSTATVNQTVSEINTQIGSLNSQISQINSNPLGMDANGNAVINQTQQNQVNELQFRVNDLNSSLTEINAMGADQNYTFVLNPMTGGAAQITADPNNLNRVIISYYSGDVGNKIHEIHHGYQVKMGQLGFSLNNGNVLVQNYNMGDEVSAWTRQYSYAGNLTGYQTPQAGTTQHTLNTFGGTMGTANQLNSNYSITNHSQITIQFLRTVTEQAIGNTVLYPSIIPN